MMLQNKYLKILSLLAAISILSGCGLFKPRVEYVTKVEYVEKKIDLQQRPKEIKLYPVYFHAVSEENIDEFLKDFEKENGDIVFFAISVIDYENLSLNVAELRRYIEQQKNLIVYYEKSIEKPIIPKE